MNYPSFLKRKLSGSSSDSDNDDITNDNIFAKRLDNRG